jgi:uncharacterized glyoxalase superfamily protein PhnB
MASDGGGTAYFHHGDASFLLQDFHVAEHAGNFMMHLQGEDVDAWRAHVDAAGLVERYGVRVGEVQTQPWRMRDFTLIDPTGVLWRIAERVD